MNKNLKENVKELNTMILEGKILEAFDKFYAEDVKMQENDQQPSIGKENCRLNEEAFVNGITEFRGAKVLNSIVSDGVVATEWFFDYTHKDFGTRTYTQIAVQRWNEQGQIISETFYYNN
ncbi:SnoaL-like domain-containing protein [Aureivirga sp. CE67]|uniref:SnoaL-like domain-containing protein n=1 Tax=Aureivirga sp. CE67 TaxID=1788983 RepID=UPI0018CA769F|nr:SnoaL-like domain-containing protein [Aureivirga sp. CE67]